MSWASRRQFVIISVLAALVLAVIAATLIAVLYETPTCSDKKRNQDEAGIDCGGSCAKVCMAETVAPQVKFVRALSNHAGRTDVIAYVVNPNTRAAVRDARYTVEIYSADGTMIGAKTGSADLAPGETLPIFIPNAYSGAAIPDRAFLTFDAASLLFFTYEDARIIPRYNDDVRLVGGNAPRITASFTNPSAELLRNVPVIATVFAADGNAIAATQTLMTELPPQGRAEVIFVWNEPFSTTPARIDVAPVVPL